MKWSFSKKFTEFEKPIHKQENAFDMVNKQYSMSFKI